MSLLLSSLLYMLSLSTVTTLDNASDSSNKHEYEYYMQKSKNQKTAATIFMATGLVGGTFTLLSALLSALGDGLIYVVSLGTYQPKKRSYTIPLLLVGGAIAVGAILFSAASRNRKIAKSLSVNVGMENTSIVQKQYIKYYAYPTLSLKISF